MAMHRVDVSVRSSTPANGRAAPSPTLSGDRLAVAAVCEWAVDLDLSQAAPIDARPATSVASAGFVDFDAIESVHVSSGATGRS
jgi:hypothetical protein